MEEISRVQEGMSRRGFVAGSILAASGVVAAGLAGCAPKDPSSMEMATTGESADDIPWDIEADVVVAGSGTAAVSAIACDTMGAGPIVILEKDAAILEEPRLRVEVARRWVFTTGIKKRALKTTWTTSSPICRL